MPARRVPLLVLTTIFSVALAAQTNTAAGAGTYPAQPEPNSFANLGVRPEVLPWDQGEAGLHLLAKKLKNTGRIMHLTAHPDDEDGALLTYLSRGQGRQVLLMSLTRGEGGQNRTGSNLWDELGVLRTLELLESTRYYGTELRFSRVADFGFSKSADETFQKWGGHQVPLRDIVYVIREWKPDVLFTRFSGTPRDGHGMHQASAILAPEAVKCAADPNCFPDQLKGDHPLTTWQVLKLYMGNQGGDYTVRYDVSQIDPDSKMSYTQMALEGFKHQASQLSGTFTPPSGPNWRSYKLVSTSIPNYKADKEQDFFDGIDTSVQGLGSRAKVQHRTVASALQLAVNSIAQASSLQVGDALKLAKGRNGCSAAAQMIEFTDIPREAKQFLASRLQSFANDFESNADTVFGKRVQVSVDKNRPLTHGEKFTISIHPAVLSSSPEMTQFAPAWRVSLDKYAVAPFADSDAKAKILSYPLTVTENVPFTRPHWHRRNPEQDAVYEVDNPLIATLPILHLPALGIVTFHAGDGQDFRYRKFAAENNPEKFVPADVVPEISLSFEQPTAVVATSGAAIPLRLKVRSTTEGAPTATVALSCPKGWTVEAAKQLTLRADQGGEIAFNVRYPARAGLEQCQATATVGKKSYSEGFSTVTRPDLDTFYYYQPAIQRVSIVDVNVPKSLRVGYIPGAGDDIFPVLQQLGLNAKLISNDELAKGDLHQYDTIVVGIRGYDERPEIRANNQRLLDFVKDGGTLLVQNQKAEEVFNSGKFTPYPATLGRQRVSVEEAPVTVLAPNDSVFNAPNKITQADFDGWVQERGINFMSDWDAKFEPLLACNDPGEQPLKGGLLRAKYGKGTYIYTGYAFFRQLPAGVPGAVRLYVNLLNAGHETK